LVLISCFDLVQHNTHSLGMSCKAGGVQDLQFHQCTRDSQGVYSQLQTLISPNLRGHSAQELQQHNLRRTCAAQSWQLGNFSAPMAN